MENRSIRVQLEKIARINEIVFEESVINVGALNELAQTDSKHKELIEHLNR